MKIPSATRPNLARAAVIGSIAAGLLFTPALLVTIPTLIAAYALPAPPAKK